MTLGGLVKHLALVEDHYLSVRLWGRPIHPPFDEVDFEADPDWEWRTAADDTPDDLYRLWHETVARSGRPHRGPGRRGPRPTGRPAVGRRSGAEPAEDPDRPHRGVRPPRGAADLLRESVDGLVGEDPTD